MKKIIETLQKIKTEKSYTLHELSKRLDIDISALSAWLNGRRQPSRTSVYKLEQLVPTL